MVVQKQSSILSDNKNYMSLSFRNDALTLPNWL